jgi:hypothetical protein
MTALSKRRARIVSVRALEHRIAAARHARAQREAQSLADVAQRLAQLNAGLGAGRGRAIGQTLNAICEMSLRLNKAGADLAAPMRHAEAQEDAARAARLCAHRDQESATRLHTKAVAREGYESALRADANRPFRKRQPTGAGA